MQGNFVRSPFRGISAVCSQARLLPGIVAAAEEAVAAGEPADRFLAGVFRTRRYLGARDRRLIGNAVFSWFRWRGWLVSPGLAGWPLRCVTAHLLDAIEVHPAIAQLAQEAGGSNAAFAPQGAASLDDKARAAELWRGIPCHADELLPSWVAAQIVCPQGVDPVGHVRRFIEAVQIRPPVWLRVRAGFEQRLAGVLQDMAIAFKPHPRIAAAWRIDGSADLRKAASRCPGAFEIQDIASQCVGLACAPQAGESWWDACAGSGGKALHLADLQPSIGTLLATDTRPGILRELARRRSEAGAHRIRAVRRDAAAAPPPDRFHGVLVDAPCSGWGMWARQPDARWRTAPDAAQSHAEAQSRLLSRCADAVQPGGRLVYSVCTLTREETEDVVQRFLESKPAFRPLPLAHALTGHVSPGHWIWPWDGPGSGMFVAGFRRTDP